RPPVSISGGVNNAMPTTINLPRRRLGDLVTAVDENSRAVPRDHLQRPGASTIYREQGERFIAVKFSVRGRDLASTVADAQEKVKPIIEPPYRTVWSGEFEEMEAADRRLVQWFSLSMVLIFALLYMAFRSLL